MTKEVAFRELLSTVCRCGRRKGKGKSVCYACWGKLPNDIRHDLYQRLGSGYEQAYGRAVAFLFNDSTAGATS